MFWNSSCKAQVVEKECLCQSSNPASKTNCTSSFKIQNAVHCVPLGGAGCTTLGDGTPKASVVRPMAVEDATPHHKGMQEEGARVWNFQNGTNVDFQKLENQTALNNSNAFLKGSKEIEDQFAFLSNPPGSHETRGYPEFYSAGSQISPVQSWGNETENQSLINLEKSAKILRATRLQPAASHLGGESTDPMLGSRRGLQGSGLGRPTHSIGPQKIPSEQPINTGLENGYGVVQSGLESVGFCLRDGCGREPLVAVNKNFQGLGEGYVSGTPANPTQPTRDGKGNVCEMSPYSAKSESFPVSGTPDQRRLGVAKPPKAPHWEGVGEPLIPRCEINTPRTVWSVGEGAKDAPILSEEKSRKNVELISSAMPSLPFHREVKLHPRQGISPTQMGNPYQGMSFSVQESNPGVVCSSSGQEGLTKGGGVTW